MGYIGTAETGCLGKQGYPTKHGAEMARARIVSRNRRSKISHKHKVRGVAALQAYQCRICGEWHLGNDGSGKVAK